MPAKVSDFPDICKTIYAERESLTRIYSTYIEELRKTSSRYNQAYANKLEEASGMLKPAKLKEFEHEVTDFKEYIQKFSKENHISLKITKRQKDFVRYNNKIRHSLITGKSLNRIRDFIGFRITLLTPSKDTMETVHLCYKVLIEAIDFFVTKKGALPMEATEVPKSDFDSNQFPNIIVPKENVSLLGEYFDNVKDFVFAPKSKGYQSLHVVIQKANGLTFEIQVRTLAMDIVAEYGSASHSIFEQERKEDSDICLDYSKINIPGFYFTPGDNSHSPIIYDNIGLIKSVDPFGLL